MEKEIPLHGEGEQSTKFGGPCPNWLQPPLCCTFKNEFPAFCPPGAVGAGVGGLFDTVICKDCCLDNPLESKTEIAKLKVPLALGVPEMVPEVALRIMPLGSSPAATEKV
jgi:hypothetical protein